MRRPADASPAVLRKVTASLLVKRADGAMMTCVALIDANRNIREFCRRELARDGYDLALFRTPQEAVGHIRDVRPDVVVVDADAFASDTGTFAPLMETLSIPVVLYDAAAPETAPHDDDRISRVAKSGDLTPLKRAIERSVGGGVRRPGRRLSRVRANRAD